ncbi:DUF1140 family protein [Bacillus inaquosorum]|uniref:DUF1140 family protein n=1 Tax=Bacillus inaquosorum TaxID=483913 RepID=UPI0022826D73|nr:DUF1140 family protein [Bacillus inaquosorum]MCY9083678.1 DUF1140 family protein [Bacillus inaquosorum]
MSQPIYFVKLYCDIILKKILSGILSNQNKKTKALNAAMKTAETSQQVRTMRHWRAVGDTQFYYEEIQKGFQRMKELDELTGWSGNLHQDRFKFIRDKYEDILNEYLSGRS